MMVSFSYFFLRYFTHFLELGYFNGPTEAESFAILTYLMTFVLGIYNGNGHS
jgi:hypothetical protein